MHSNQDRSRTRFDASVKPMNNIKALKKKKTACIFRIINEQKLNHVHNEACLEIIINKKDEKTCIAIKMEKCRIHVVK